MAVSQEIKDLCTRIDTATNAVATLIRALADQIAGGVSAADGAEIKTKLMAAADRLEVLGKDPVVPVPPPVPPLPVP